MGEGTIRTFSEETGFGHIAPDTGGLDVFFPGSEVEGERRLLIPGASVLYNLDPGGHGMRAINVRLATADLAATPPTHPRRRRYRTAEADNGAGSVLTDDGSTGSAQQAEDHATATPRVVPPHRRAGSMPKRPTPANTRVFWWARRLPEAPRIDKPHCQRVNCARAAKEPFDLYCHGRTGNAHFMPLAARGASRATITALGVGAIVLAAAAGVAGAAIASPIPIYCAAAALGLCTLALPLRYFSTSRIVAVSAWLGLLLLLACWREGIFDSTAERWIIAGMAGTLLTAFVATAGIYNDALTESIETIEGEEIREAVPLFGSAIGLGALVVVLKLTDVPVSAQLIDALASVALAMLALSISWATLVGFTIGVKEATYTKPFVQPVHGEARRLKGRNDPREPGEGAPYSAHLSYQLMLFAIRVSRVLLQAAQAVVNGVWWVWHVTIVSGAWMLHASIVIAHRMMEVLLDTVAALLGHVWFSGKVIFAAARYWLRSSVATALLLVGAVVLSVIACDWFQSYLTGGSLARGPLSLCLGTVTAAVLVLVWWVTTAWPAADVRNSAVRTSELAGATLFLTGLGAGWVADLASWVFGAGPIRPGLLTIIGTVILVTTMLWLGALKPAPEPDSEMLT
jgi:cold shock CspA family protein